MLTSLDIFKSHLPIQTNILGNRLLSYKPITSLDNRNVIEFSVKDAGNTYKDLNSICLKLRLKLCKKDLSDYAETDKNQPGVVNNILHSLFKQCDVYLNGKLVTQSGDNYHYRSYFENILLYGQDASRTHLRNVGWEPDTGKDINKTDDTNAGFVTRKGWFANSREVELYGRLHVDIFNQPLLLINGVNIDIKLTLANDEFYLMGAAGGTIRITDATLYVQHFDINPSILIAHNKMLENENAKYHYKRTEIKTFTFPPGSRNISLDNVTLGPVADKVVVTFVDNASSAGTIETNSFALSHYLLEYFSLYVNGHQFPPEGLECDFGSKKQWARAYDTIFSGSGIKHSDRGNQITYDMFAHGYFMLVFDLTPDGSGNEDYIGVSDSGTMRIEARFGKELAKTITCLVYLEYNSTLEIDKDRNIITNF